MAVGNITLAQEVAWILIGVVATTKSLQQTLRMVMEIS
jgi:hypothetical protein